MARQKIHTVRLTIDVRTLDPEELIAILQREGDALGDNFVSVTLAAMGFDGKAQAGGTIIHDHEPEDRTCQGLLRNDRLYREDGQDEL